MKKKLTAVTVNFRGQTAQAFVMCDIVKGADGKEKTICPPHVIAGLTRTAGCTMRGQTYTFG